MDCYQKFIFIFQTLNDHHLYKVPSAGYKVIQAFKGFPHPDWGQFIG